MNIQQMKKMVAIVLLLGISALVQAEDTPGLNGGVACVVQAGEGNEAFELAQSGKFIVLALDADAAKVAALKEKAAVAGLLGRSLYVEQGAADKIPFADNYVDLLLLSKVEEKNLSESMRAEITRVLTPIHGRAILKDHVIEKPELEGSDWWTHKLHGPNNNPVSTDTVFQFPPILQYRAMPMYNSYNGAALTSHGRQILLHDWTYHDPFRGSLAGSIQVRNSYNGQILWEGMLPKGIEVNTPIFAATEKDLLMASGDNAHVLRRDLNHGDELAPIVLGGEDRRVKWLAVADDTLFALLGDPSVVRRPYEWMIQHDIFAIQEKEQSLFGNELVAYDLKTDKNIWSHRESVNIDYRAVAQHEGRLYFYAEGKRLACLDGMTGNELWSNADEQWITGLARPKKVRNGNIIGMSTLKVADGIVLLAIMEGSKGLFFRSEDGKLLTDYINPGAKRRPYSGQKTIILNGEVYRSDVNIDLETGEISQVKKIDAPGSTAWCGIVTYSPGTGALGHSSLGYKTPCGVGAWVAGGILLYSPSICVCDNHMAGAGAYASGAEIFDRIKHTPEHPIVKGPAYTKPTVNESTEGEDWPGYRGDARHRGSSRTKIGAAVKTVWTAAPEHPFAYNTQYNLLSTHYDERPTAPVIADGRVCLAGSDGMVVARSLSDGKTLWTHAIDGPVLTAPAYENGRLFVPGADGWVYALDARTGQLSWKRRVAPIERRIAVFQNLMSTWPVLSLAVENGTVYACAGMSIINGSTTLALDAATGDIRWSCPIERTLAGSHQAPEGDAVGLGGVTAVHGDTVWIAGYGSIPLCIDKRDGKVIPLQPEIRTLREKGNYFNFRGIYHMQGMHLVGLDDKTIIGGGRALFENHQMREGKQKRTEFKMYFSDDQGRPDFLRMPVRFVPVGRVAPAVDEALTALAALPATDEKGRTRRTTHRATHGLRVWETAKLVSEGQAMVNKETSDKKKLFWSDVHRLLDDSKELWSKPEIDVNALALAADVLLVAHAGKAVEASGREFSQRLAEAKALVEYDDWRITAFERLTGEERWSVPLPSEPLYDGLAIADDGTVVVTLRDGTVVAFANGSSKTERKVP